MTPKVSFRQYTQNDRASCLAIFDANCPEFFAPNERNDYEQYLRMPAASYEVCDLEGRVVASFGLDGTNDGAQRLTWIMLNPTLQGTGIGSEIMNRVISKSQEQKSTLIKIAASQKSAPFFARFGAETISFTKDGWGPGMDRVDMEIRR